MCQHVNLRNKPHYPHVARGWITHTAAAQKKVLCRKEHHNAPASRPVQQKHQLYVPPEATTNGTVQLALNSQQPIWPVLRTID